MLCLSEGDVVREEGKGGGKDGRGEGGGGLKVRGGDKADIYVESCIDERWMVSRIARYPTTVDRL